MEGATRPAGARPARGDLLDLTVESLAFGGAGVARLNGYVVFVQDGMPGDQVRAEVQKSKRAYAEARAIEILEPGPDRIEPRADHPGAPWQVLPYERQLEVKQAQVDEALRRIGAPGGVRARADRARDRAVALPQQARVLVRNRRQRAAGVRLSRPRPVGGDRRADRLPARVRAPPTPLASGSCSGAGPRASRRIDRRTRRGVPAQPGGPRGPPDRRAAGPAGHRRRAASTGEGLIDAAEPVGGLLWTRTDSVAETTQGGETELLAGGDRLEEEIGGLAARSPRTRSFRPTPRWPSGCTALAIEYAAPTASTASTTCTAGSAPSGC